MLQSVARTRILAGTSFRCASVFRRNELYMAPRVLDHTSKASYSEEKLQKKLQSFVLPNPFRWLGVFLEFMELKNNWDPEFSRTRFMEGTKQAISTVLSLVATQRLDDLTGLVTREALNNFIQQASEKLGYGNTQYLNDPDEIIAMPRKVHLQSIVDQKYCDVDVDFLVIKKLESSSRAGQATNADLLMCLLLARFHRNYSPGRLPEWTITRLSFNKVTPTR
ncbi:uncharacterized protein LOC135391094 isoform X1 [Ornithodoros turicata]|uniref:uncharacterized protein LOC135391094 isoform X1 n=1 Tax=Ornithodoros turicata TaxID=34597 RepID=UPI0031396D33